MPLAHVSAEDFEGIGEEAASMRCWADAARAWSWESSMLGKRFILALGERGCCCDGGAAYLGKGLRILRRGELQ
jgi:hypothetical protein